MISKNKPSISPLIATILLIIVAVAIIAIVVTWGKGFANTSLSSADNILEESSFSNFIYFDKIIDNKLYLKNTHQKEDLEITKYKIISSRQDHNYTNINTYHYFYPYLTISKSNINYIDLPCIIDSSFTIEIVTSNHEYISIPITIKNYKEYSYLDCLLILDFDSTNGEIKDNTVGNALNTVIDNINLNNWISIGGSIVNNYSFTTTNNSTGFAKSGILIPGRKYRLLFLADTDSSAITIRNYLTDSVYLTNSGVVEFVALDSGLYIRNTSPGTTKINTFILQEIKPELTITDVNLTSRGAEFNGTTSKIDTGADMIGTKAVTLMGWAYPYSKGQNSLGVIFSNGRLLYRFLDYTDYMQFTSDSITYLTVTHILDLNKFHFISMTRKSDGLVTFYIGSNNLVPAINGGSERYSGIPILGTTNVIIGNNSIATRTFDGIISKVKIYDGILTQEEINKIYNDNKYLLRDD